METDAQFAAERQPITPPPEAEVQRVQQLGDRQLKLLRDTARNDLFFLASGILGYKDVNIYTHGPLCRFLALEPSSRRLVLMPRGHLKSTLCTIADSVRLALRNPDECRILIMNETEDNAIGFLAEIKAHFVQNEMLRTLFPELIPEKVSGPGSTWSATMASLKRGTGYKEGTWSAVGGKTAAVSRHFTHIKVDDIIGLEAKRSPTVMKAAIEVIDNLDPLLINLDEDTIDFIGTRKLIHDAYAHVMRLYEGELKIYRRSPIEDGKPIFPQKFTVERLLRIKELRPEFYAAEYENDPVGRGVRDFDVGKVKRFVFANNGDVVYKDDAGELRRWPLEQLNIVIAADPNSGELTAPDFAGVIVSGVSPDDQVFVLETWSDRVTPTDIVDKIFELAKRWHPSVVGIEQAGQQSTRFYFAKKAREEGQNFQVIPLKPKNRDKPTRIRNSLEPIINAGRLFLLDSQTTLRRQIEFHPDLENDDEIDPLAYGTEEGMWSVPTLPGDEDDEDDETLREKLALTGRNLRTGY